MIVCYRLQKRIPEPIECTNIYSLVRSLSLTDSSVRSWLNISAVAATWPTTLRSQPTTPHGIMAHGNKILLHSMPDMTAISPPYIGFLTSGSFHRRFLLLFTYPDNINGSDPMPGITGFSFLLCRHFTRGRIRGSLHSSHSLSFIYTRPLTRIWWAIFL